MLLGDVVAMGAHKYGDRVAVVFNDQEISFTELAGRTRRLANALLGLTAPGARVAILSQNRPEFVDAYFGVPMAGMGLTFLNYRLNPASSAGSSTTPRRRCCSSRTSTPRRSPASATSSPRWPRS